MTSLNLQHWQQRLYEKLPTNLKTFFQAGARSQLLKQVNTVLMIHDDRLYDIANGTWRQLPTGATQPSAEAVATAAHELLEPQTESRSILLLLPSCDFIATSVNMPGVARETLRSALQLQTGVLLPSYEGELAFAVNPAGRREDGGDIVLWTDERRVDALFDAFTSHGLFLTSVMPRVLAAVHPAEAMKEVRILDSDARNLTQISYVNGVIDQWLQIERVDLQDDQFLRQWQEATAPRPEASAIVSMASAEAYLSLPAAVAGDREYAFVPTGAQAARRQTEKGKRLMYAAAAAVILLFLGSTPLLLQSLQARSLSSTLDEQRELASAARADQAVVREFEQRWGALSEFPRQNFPEILQQLQSVVSPSVLSSLEVDEGTMQIEGESPDPQGLLEQLEQNPMFTGVDFARATNNNRYYIELRLSTVDFDGYRQRYFPDVRR